jgi:beta-galactosidase
MIHLVSRSLSGFPLALLALLAFLISETAFSQRQVESLNSGWRFIRMDAAAFEQEETNDQYWKRVHLPHTWNAEDAFDDERGYFQGIGCYRNHWLVPDSWRGQTVVLRFEGANHTAEVYLNGKKLKTHVGGYTSFRVDVTPHLLFGKPNLLAVRVNNGADPGVAPLSADFTFYGGLYRGVSVIRTGHVHFGLDHFGADALHWQPRFTPKSWFLDVETKVQLGAAANYQLEAVLMDSSRKPIARKSWPMALKKGPGYRFSWDLGNLPGLWSPRNPKLYTVRFELKEAGNVVDVLEGSTAFFRFRMDPNLGAFVNEKPVKLMGVCRHQDHAGLGNALPDGIHEKDIRSIVDMGGNFIRIAHYPQSDVLLSACDRMGILAWEEIPVVNEITPSATFFANAASQLQEMIAQHRNHPSVVMWGYMNEVFLAFGKHKTDSAKQLHNRETVRLAKFLDSIAHSVDPARLTTMALHNSTRYNESGIADVANVTGWNLYHGWYHDAFPDFGAFMDKEKSKYPKRIHMISEFGAGSDQRLLSLEPQIYDFSPQYQLQYHQSYLRQIFERPWIAGGAMWNLVDFGSEGRKETMPHINNKGLLTMDRTPKDAWYLYLAFLHPKPMARLAIGDAGGRILVKDGKIRIPVISNQAEVMLFHENQKIGEVKVSDRMGIIDMAAPTGPIWIRLENQKGQVLGHQELIPTWMPDLKDPGFRELAVNVGSNCAYLQPKTNTMWWPSQEYAPGSWGVEGGKRFRSSRTRIGTQAYIELTPDQPLYQTMQDSLTAFRADVPDGKYVVDLLFAELEPNIKPTNVLYDLSSNRNPNKNGFNRVFSVFVNGKIWKEKFEPAQEPGPYRAGCYSIETEVKDGKGLLVEFGRILGNPCLNGIRIWKR